MQLSPKQTLAADAVRRWLDSQKSPWFYLAGYAGSGKTSIAKALTESVRGSVLFACYTGKAAHVLTCKGCAAQTLHSLIYIPAAKGRSRLLELHRMLDEARVASQQPEAKMEDHLRVRQLEEKVREEEENHRRPHFTLNLESPLKKAGLLVVDEVSMVSQQMAEDLLSFGVPILVLGDPAQLPPVRDEGYFTSRNPDFFLDEIHRQAAGSPVLQLATRARQGQHLPLGDYGGGTKVISAGTLTLQDLASFDQVIVGKNVTRKNINHRMRTGVLGRKGPLPEPGDKLICLRNDYDAGVLNGSQWICESAQVLDDDRVELAVRGDDGTTLVLDSWRHWFEGREDQLRPWDMRKAQQFDFGYAITCHKAQGSSWGSVLVRDESEVFRDNRWKWIYSAITRAAERVVVAR